MKELDESLEKFPIKELIAYYYQQADETIIQEERLRYIATVYWLTMFEKLPF